MEKDGIIFSIRHLEWISNLVVLRKKNEAIYLCVDLWDLNQASLKYSYRLRNMESLLQQVTGSKFMSMLAGFSGYNQVLMVEEDNHKTMFTTPWGTYAYNIMPFGMKNA